MLLIKALPATVFHYIEMVQMKHIHKVLEFLINKNTAEEKISFKKNTLKQATNTWAFSILSLEFNS